MGSKEPPSIGYIGPGYYEWEPVAGCKEIVYVGPAPEERQMEDYWVRFSRDAASFEHDWSMLLNLNYMGKFLRCCHVALNAANLASSAIGLHLT